MIKTDESALECDLAETYGIYDYRSLPLNKVATFSVGLRENSRIKMKLVKTEYSFETILLASILDNLRIQNWRQTKDAIEGINMPESITDRLLGKETTIEKEYKVFNSAEEFNEMRNKLIKKGGE